MDAVKKCGIEISETWQPMNHLVIKKKKKQNKTKNH